MFESATRVTAEGGRRRWGALPIAVLAHAVALGGVLVAQYSSLEELDAPLIVESFWEVQLPPAGGGGGPRPRAEAPKEPAAVPPSQETLPVPPPPLTQPDPEASAAEIPVPTADTADTGVHPFLVDAGDSGEGTAWGDGSGDGPGLGPGDGSGPGLGDGGGTEIFRIVPGISPPRVVHRVEPRYPEAARRARRQGRVVLEAVIDPLGRIDTVRVLTPPLGFGLEEAAIAAVRQWRFTPAARGGAAIPVYFTLTVDFALR